MDIRTIMYHTDADGNSPHTVMVIEQVHRMAKNGFVYVNTDSRYDKIQSEQEKTPLYRNVMMYIKY